MSSTDDNVILIHEDDKEIVEANQKARSTFKYFWREVVWERRRIVPGLDMACVKAPFSDGVNAKSNVNEPSVEHMWIGEVDFDGHFVTGTLMNSPNWLKTVKSGEKAKVPLEEIDDWMYVIRGKVYGGYTIHLTRMRMSARDRKQHDSAWGLNFPDQVKLVYFGKVGAAEENTKPKGFMGGLLNFNPKPATADDTNPDAEHPASIAIVPGLKGTLLKNPNAANEKDERGWTALHHEALAGSEATVKVLLDFGADTSARNEMGMTALDLARILGWSKVEELLMATG